jgi:outer membrane protein assembly factor BamB
VRPVIVLAVVAAMLTACGAPSRGAGSRSPGSTTTAPPGASPSSSSPGAAPPAAGPAAWPEFGGGPSRTGLDAGAPPLRVLTPAWVSPTLDGAVYAQPLVAGATVVVATENDTVYALSSATGAVRWKHHLATPVAGGKLPCGDINPSGITGTPALDPATGTLWVTTFSSPAHHTLWGLDVATGSVRSSRPVDPPGADPRAEQQRAALTLDAGRVYVSYGGLFGDCSDYHGWVVGVPEAGAGPAVTFETPTQREGGIWAPGGPVVGDGGSLYVATGNGTPATSVDDANSVLRLSTSLTVESRFTPSDYAALSASDSDEGSTSPALLPGGVVFQVGKDGTGYLLDAARLGGTGGQLGSIRACSGGFGGDAVDGDEVVFSCFDSLTAVRVAAGAGGHRSMSVAWRVGGIQPGPPVIAGGVAWAVNRSGALDGYSLASGVRKASAPLTSTGGFPTLAAAGGDLYVPARDRVTAFSGV